MAVHLFEKFYKNKINTNKPISYYLTNEEISIHKSLKNILIMAQIFGFLPVKGLTNPDFRSLKFHCKSFQFLITLVYLLGASFLSSVQFHKMIVKGTDFAEIDRFCFFFCGVISLLLFLKLAKHWPCFMREWDLVEKMMIKYERPNYLNRTLRALTFSFMALALTVEHILVQSNKLFLALQCKNTTGEAFNYFLSNMSFSHLFSLTKYNIVKGLVVQTINLQLTFSWTYIDLFIMLISTCLAFHFNRLSIKLQNVSNFKVQSEIIWRNLREDYNKLCILCRKVNQALSNIVLLAFASDLFFILVQLFHSLTIRRNNLERAYFYTSFTLLISKTVCLCLFGAKVHEESRKPIAILNSVPSTVYNAEIERFIQQITSTEIAITGKNFFNIKRGIILSIACAIVTYELVLLQFNGNIIVDTLEKNGSCAIFI